MIDYFSEEYSKLKRAKKELEDLFLHSGMTSSNIELIEGNDETIILRINCICESKTGYNTKFHKDLNIKNVDGFISKLKTAMKLSVISDKKITMYPVISGGIQDFWYYINEEKIEDYELQNMFNEELHKYKETINNEIFELNELLRKLSYLGSKYQDMIINYNRTKENIVNELSKNRMLQTDIKTSENNSLINDVRHTIEAGNLVELLKSYDYGKRDKKITLFQTLDDIEQKTIKGETVNINITNTIFSDDIDDIIILNKLIEILTTKISHIEKTLKLSIDQAELQFKSLKELVAKINETKAKNKSKIFNQTILDDIKKVKIDELNPEIKHYKDYTTQKIQDSDVWAKERNDESFKQLAKKQAELLTSDEVIALNLYKTQLYRAFNPIINFAREKSLNDDDIKENETFNQIIKTAYDEMVKAYEYNHSNDPGAVMNRMHQQSKSYDELTIGEKIFRQFPNELPTYEQYKILIYNNIKPLLTSLKKITLDEDLVVFRGDNGNNYENIKGITSTTISKKQAKDFIENRDQSHKQTGLLYKITIPKGSPVICFTDELLYGKDKNQSGFNDSQGEIIFDENLFDLEYNYDNPIDFNEQDNGVDKAAVYITVKATPKVNNEKII